MLCSFCGKKFIPLKKDQDVCDECIHSVEELTDGKGDDDDDE